MHVEETLEQLRAGVAFDQVAQAFMQAQKDADCMGLLVDLKQLMCALEEQEGPWSTDAVTWPISPELISALSKAWKQARPVNRGWREELYAVTLILSGKFRQTSYRDLNERLSPEMANFLSF